MARHTFPVKEILLAAVWILFVSAVIQFGGVLGDGGFDKHPTGAMVLIGLCGFLAGGCISLTKAYIRVRREGRETR